MRLGLALSSKGGMSRAELALVSNLGGNGRGGGGVSNFFFVVPPDASAVLTKLPAVQSDLLNSALDGRTLRVMFAWCTSACMAQLCWQL